MATYSELLKDPRWQKKRLEIMQRDNFTCQLCFDDKKTLHIHHRRYIHGRKPWEYPDQFLITLCESCHEDEAELWDQELPTLIEQLKDKFFGDDLWFLANAFNGLEIRHTSKFTSHLISFLFHSNNKEIWDSIEKKFCDEIREFIKNEPGRIYETEQLIKLLNQSEFKNAV